MPRRSRPPAQPRGFLIGNGYTRDRVLEQVATFGIAVEWCEPCNEIMYATGDRETAEFKLRHRFLVGTPNCHHPRIARKGTESSTTLRQHRWVIERSIAWLLGYRRLTIRYERKATHYLAFLTLAATITCYKKLAK